MPAAHTNSVVGAAVHGTQLITCGLDDRACWSGIAAGGAGDARAAKLPCAPKSMAVSADGLAFLVTVQGVATARDGSVSASTRLPGAAVAAITRDGRTAAVGCDDGRVHVFTVAPGGALQPLAVLSKHRGAVTALTFCASSDALASCDVYRELVVWSRVADGFTPATATVFHTARVACLAWSPDGTRLASGGLDCNLCVWDVSQPASTRVVTAAAHRDGITGVCWRNNSELVSTGGDACVRRWTL
jgi:WD40 repeat protein